MGTEIERKFLVRRDRWQPDPATGTRCRQGYLVNTAGCTIRIRIAGEVGFLTIKGPTTGISRLEFEYPIPLVDAEQLLGEFCAQPLIEKVRHLVPWAGQTWEVDVFEGDNAGLIVAEIELPDADAGFDRPPWLGEEVSHDPRYFNAALTRNPWSRWGKEP
jgi:adenylate cyclase